jgi:hypothetical protein
MTTSLFSDNPLLNDAESVLIDAGFSTRRGVFASADAPCLFAEDEFFVVAVVASRTLEEARRIESFAAAELLEQVGPARVGAKRWDAYLVLLAEEVIDDVEQGRDLVELQYNTRGVRRLVATGVGDRDSLTIALRPFLPLPQPVPGGLSDALSDLTDQLVINGVDRENAARYVGAFEQSGSLDDV